jgi:hypothetical protein
MNWPAIRTVQTPDYHVLPRLDAGAKLGGAGR